jgi:hypothetical protein
VISLKQIFLAKERKKVAICGKGNTLVIPVACRADQEIASTKRVVAVKKQVWKAHFIS